MDIEQAFGIVIKRYRLERLMSQEELAFESGLDRTFISLLERGKRRPTIVTLFSISEALQLPPHSIVIDIETLITNN
ncbi:helix-turn-helix domain-containing protein [Priestia megaterium]|uniref:helix-turn-helix domain-containing protein n=1 Tax=Priestia megaterium TaxID=1404 RepID=UPI00054DCE19|nr:helix-turn-helix transcriptional regulator [Priestia megaterium]MDH3140459.1 helix-turn-helix transcriptional regulator [Priestia megaterium]